MADRFADAAPALGRKMASALKDFHQALILAEASDDEAMHNPYTLLFAVIGDPRFAWTNGLAQLIVRLDEMLKEGELSSLDDLAPFRDEVVRMLDGGEGEDPAFRLQYLMAVQKAPGVALATGNLRRMLARLPAAESG